MSKIDTLLHPIRFRIVALMAGGQMTPQQIAARLTDIPQTTLYRHINTLLDENILRVVSETQVRGTVERTLAMVEGAGRLSEEEAATMSKEDHLTYFITFLSSVLQDFNEYIEGDETRQMLYSKTPLYLNDAEFLALLGKMQGMLSGYTQRKNGDQRRYLFTGITIPDEGKP